MRANCQRWSWARARRRHWVRLGGGEGWCESERVGEVGESRSKLGSKIDRLVYFGRAHACGVMVGGWGGRI